MEARNVPQQTNPGVIGSELTRESLAALLNGELLAIRSPYLPPQSCQPLVERLLREERAAYTHELYKNGKPTHLHYGVDRIGVPFNMTYGHPIGSPIFDMYHSRAASHLKRMEEICEPLGGNPILALIRELDRLHPHGAEVASFRGREMFAGIVRIMEPHLEGKERLEAQPHFDSLPPDFHRVTSQLSANIYVALPEPAGPGQPPHGGELELWDVPPLDQHAIEAAAPETDWRSRLPAPVQVTPKLGELILINTRRPHAVRTLQRGTRISLQTFIGASPEGRLLCWN